MKKLMTLWLAGMTLAGNVAAQDAAKPEYR